MMRTNGEARPGKRRRGDSNSGGESFWEIKMGGDSVVEGFVEIEMIVVHGCSG